MKRWMGSVVCFFLAVVVMVPLSSAANEPDMVVGRIFHIEGELLRYIPAEKDWVAVVRDAPFGTEDTLFSGSRGMAELIVPNGTWIRIGNSTQIQFIILDTDLSEMDVASGVARFYNKSSDTVIKVTSPFGYVLSYPGTVFDFYVGENSVEAVAIKGQVSFVHLGTEAKYSVAAGSPSILADQRQVSSDEGIVDPDWNLWNMARENFWAAKARLGGRSVEYLPPSLHDESYALDENGRWERVPYEGTTRWFWRPRVTVGWSPFTVGRWTDWYGDQTWIPTEPFGYITHHYGNWIFLGKYWYWAPPVVSVRVGLPLLDVGFFWYPGRVSWIHSGIYVGWVPLTPRETYYSHRHWGGPHAVVITSANLPGISINLQNYAYVNRAIVIPQKDFYSVNNYRKVQVTQINPATIINNYRAVPVVNNMVIKDYATDKQRYNFINVKVNEKPHNTVINRIQQNQAIIREGRKKKPSVIQERMKSIPEGKVNREARIEAPKVTNYIVPANQVDRPKSEIKLQQREIKPSGKPAARPKRVEPGKPAPPEQPAARPGRVAPATPSQQEKPAQPKGPERVSPAKPAPPEQPAVRSERVEPPKSPKQEKPDQPAVPERVSPAKPASPKQPAARPERLAPVKPAEKGVDKSKKVEKPESVTKEGRPQEKVGPGKPKETTKPSEKRAVEKPKEVKPIEKVLEKSREVKPPERDLEKPKEPRPSENNLKKQRERKPPEEEGKKPKE